MIDVAGRKFIDDAAGAKNGARKGSNAGQSDGLWDWGVSVVSYSLEGNGVIGQAPQPDELISNGLKMSQEIMAAPRYADDFHLLSLNTDNLAQADTVYQEFIIQYILGQTSDYDGFVKRWLASGGQALQEEATQQLRSYGRIK
jgi:hypothetical protein